MRTSRILLLPLFVTALGASVSSAQTDKDIAVMLKTKGKVEMNTTSRGRWFFAKRGHRLHDGYQIRTGENSLAALIFTDDRTQLKVRSNSSLTINGKRETGGILKRLSLGFGQLWASVTRQNTEMQIDTPSGVATVKGTDIMLLFEDGVFFGFCISGLMEFRDLLGGPPLMLGPGQMAMAQRGQRARRIDRDPNDVFDMSDVNAGFDIKIDFENQDGQPPKSLIFHFNQN